MDKPKYSEYGLTQWLWLVRYKENLTLGKNTQIGNFVVIGCENGVEIQNNVKIGYHCVIMSESTIDGKRGKITLKEGCRIGANSVIFPGITIGENSIIGACSLVNRDVPANEMWYGIPARFIRKLTKDELEIGVI